MKIVECVPNFSEGRRPEVIDEIVKAIESVSGVTLLDKEMNSDHNRAVVTFIGEPAACLEAAFRATKKASELIDLRTHKGEHPRVGATDVIPFVPIANVTTEECVELAKALGKRISEELRIPVYLYEDAAQRPDRVDLANIRKGEFEGLREAIKTDPDRIPDFGKPELHPSAGATVVGARFPLIAYNINLNTQDLSIAKKIAKTIRFRDGGFPYVKALGFEIKEKNCVQVSINMTNYQKTPLYRVFEKVREESQQYGVTVKESEIVGLVPQQALIDVATYFLQLNEFNSTQILENRLVPGQSLADFLQKVSSKEPTPGGGSCAALAGALGTALLIMVVNLTVHKKGYETVTLEMQKIKEELEPIGQEFYALIELDSQAFEKVMSVWRLPKNTEEEKRVRQEKILESLKLAIEVPFQVLEKSQKVLSLCKPIIEKGNKNAVTDAGTGIAFLSAALKGARLNILVNLVGISDEDYRKTKLALLHKIYNQGIELISELETIVETRLK